MEVTEEGYMIEGTWLEVVAADALLEVSVVAFEGNRACRGRTLLLGMLANSRRFSRFDP